MKQVTEQLGFTPMPHEDVGNMIAQSNADLYLFSSDYPHIEGTRDPIARFERTLPEGDEQIRTQFYTENFLRFVSASSRALMSDRYDAVIVGAGFGGMYMLYRLRQLGMTARVLEMGDDVGGTWYWNRYPGARCDAESLAYSFSFSPELEQTWSWSERYATQPEILQYAQHVADRFGLREHIEFNQKVTAAHYDEAAGEWEVRTEQDRVVRARFCVMATGCLSVPQLPAIKGVEDFAGPRYQASLWPHEGVDFSGKTVGVIGTGSSGIQAIPVIAEQAEHLYVFQRTPNYSVPAANAPLDQAWVEQFKQNYRDHRRFHKLGLSSGFGDLDIEPVERTPMAETAVGLSDEQVAEILDPYWERGGAFFLSAFADAMNRSGQQRTHCRVCSQ